MRSAPSLGVMVTIISSQAQGFNLLSDTRTRACSNWKVWGCSFIIVYVLISFANITKRFYSAILFLNFLQTFFNQPRKNFTAERKNPHSTRIEHGFHSAKNFCTFLLRSALPRRPRQRQRPALRNYPVRVQPIPPPRLCQQAIRPPLNLRPVRSQPPVRSGIVFKVAGRE